MNYITTKNYGDSYLRRFENTEEFLKTITLMNSMINKQKKKCEEYDRVFNLHDSETNEVVLQIKCPRRIQSMIFNRFKFN